MLAQNITRLFFIMFAVAVWTIGSGIMIAEAIWPFDQGNSSQQTNQTGNQSGGPLEQLGQMLGFGGK